MKLLLERVPPRKGGAEGAKRVLGTLDLPRNATVDDLKKEFAQLKSKYYAERQEWRLPLQDGQRRGEAIKGGKTLESYGLKDGSVVYFKDLGTQVSLGIPGVPKPKWGRPSLNILIMFTFRLAIQPYSSGSILDRLSCTLCSSSSRQCFTGKCSLVVCSDADLGQTFVLSNASLHTNGAELPPNVP